MKINDFIYRYKTNLLVDKAGICRVRTFVNYADEKIYALLTELEENPSTSVTNAIETIADALIRAKKIPAEAILIDHYPKTRFSMAEDFQIVSFAADGRPSWSPLSMKQVLLLLDCPVEEFADYQQDPRVKKEIFDAIKGIPRIQQFEYIEDPDVTERRLQIEANRHSFDAVRRMLASKPNEAKMSAFIKQDLSLMAENYAHPEEEYICFSEFPVGDGRVDFVVFTGRSRMSVYLIEIKGADKLLRRKNHYGAFKAAAQEGQEQLQQRAEWCQSNYEKFRKFTYKILAEVGRGNRPYHAFVGPRYRLNVDPNKDIHLFYVLIAGRTGDDIADSHKRHIVETSSKINLQTETWDSWLNKLTRE